MTTDLVALPYAGAAGTAYRPWGEMLQPDLNLHALTLPGHGPRMAEPALTTIDTVVDDVLTQLALLGVGDDYVLFGHSMGALVAYETARRLDPSAAVGHDAAGDLSMPRALVVSGLDAPVDACATQAPAAGPERHELPDDELVALLREYDGTPPELLERDVLKFFLPTLRADLGVVDTYRHRSGAPLQVPVVCYRGMDDPRMSHQGAVGWEQLTTGEFRLRTFDGDHFYLHDRTPVCFVLRADAAWATRETGLVSVVPG